MGLSLGLGWALLLLLLLLVEAEAAAAAASNNNNNSSAAAQVDSSNTVPASFRPSIAVIVGVLTTMFSLTFLLLIYAKHCKRGESSSEDDFILHLQQQQQQQQHEQQQPGHGGGGVEAAVVQALPTFTFESLKGNKEGLECAVCLCRYEERELLRFLPKCKHAFHVHCLDTWLTSHSTCPLCRHHVSAQDAAIVDDMIIAMRRNSLDAPPGAELQIYVHAEGAAAAAEPEARKVRHRIILSDVVLQRRWSDVVPSDVLFLGGSQTVVWPSSAVAASSSSSFLKRALSMGSRSTTRCMSELDSRRTTRKEVLQVVGGSEYEDDRRWNSIAKRTLQWLSSSSGGGSGGGSANQTAGVSMAPFQV